MKYAFISFFAFCSVIAAGQTPIQSGSIPTPVYDTVSIDIQSKNSFYFCKQLFAIPRNCEDSIQSDCCMYDAQISRFTRHHSSAQIGCYNGTSLYWNIFEEEQQAKNAFDSYPGQIKMQMKTFNQTEISMQVCNKPVKALRLNYTTRDGHAVYQLMFFGNINGEVIFGHLRFLDDIRSSKQLTPFFQQLVQF